MPALDGVEAFSEAEVLRSVDVWVGSVEQYQECTVNAATTARQVLSRGDG